MGGCWTDGNYEILNEHIGLNRSFLSGNRSHVHLDKTKSQHKTSLTNPLTLESCCNDDLVHLHHTLMVIFAFSDKAQFNGWLPVRTHWSIQSWWPLVETVISVKFSKESLDLQLDIKVQVLRKQDNALRPTVTQRAPQTELLIQTT